MKEGNVLNEIQELPAGVSGAGHEFSYASWSAGTRVTLANVPWNSDYRDIVRFDNQTGLDNYLDNLAGATLSIGNMSQTPMNRPVRLDIPFERANQYNYLRAYNPAQPLTSPGGDTGRSYYYFVAAVNYIAPNTTEMVLQLDVWQTFGYGARFGNCYIEQGHIGWANENQFNDNGREFLTQPEGLDLGGEYQIVDQWGRDIASARNRTPGDSASYSILVTTSVALDADPGDTDHPKMYSATGSAMENLPNGTEAYIFARLADFQAFMLEYSNKPYITQGIQSITAIPPASEYAVNSTSAIVSGVSVRKVSPGSLRTKQTVMKTNWRDSLLDYIPRRYWNLKKLLTYPYTLLEMTSYTGTPLVLKPESWSDNDATVTEIPHFAQPGARLMFAPYRYNAAQPGPDPTSDASGLINDGGEFLDMACGIFNFPQFSIVNDGYHSYLAANANSIAFQHSSADWSQTRALAGNQVGADQATGAINTSKDLMGIGIDASAQMATLNNETAAYKGMQAAGNATVNGFRNMDPLGMAVGVANASIDYHISANQTLQSQGIGATAARRSNAASTGQAGYVRDTNKAYGDMAARGDYQNALAGINAKVQDARMIQPTTAGQVGGDAFLLASYKWGYDIKVKMLQTSALAVLGEYWLRYGYKVNRFGRMPESFMVTSKFTYWKLKETYITASNCPETFKQTIRGIFEKGVTVWKNPADIGNIDMADNYPLAGVRL